MAQTMTNVAVSAASWVEVGDGFPDVAVSTNLAGDFRVYLGPSDPGAESVPYARGDRFNPVVLEGLGADTGVWVKSQGNESVVVVTK